ncbi:hypothetical protein CDW43_05430 [Methylophaga nitratireducenticrescens]|nr:hypothetical protein CDW43_05430 [Methylophaga nitratireducenticrescens]
MSNLDSQNMSQRDITAMGKMIRGMRAAYANGENAMEYARNFINRSENLTISTLIAYDLQAGNYVDHARSHTEERAKWCKQLAKILSPFLTEQSSVLEVGCGEATTLSGVLNFLENKPKMVKGLDISWSRCAHGRNWLEENHVSAELFVADLFQIPMEDSSVDVVYTSHSLEPNGGNEEAALKELLRVSRRAVILVEPLYELADSTAQARMREHGYVRGLKETAERLGAKVTDYRLLDYSGNPLNPSGLIKLEKQHVESPDEEVFKWRCPLTHSKLISSEHGYYSPDVGVVYPVLAGIPLLMQKHAIIASSFESIAVGNSITKS